MKQIIIVVSDRRKYEELIDNNAYYVAWCGFTIQDIMRLRDRSNEFVFCVDGEDPVQLKKIGLYMRDLCLEDEKFVSIYGEKTGVDILNSLIPSLFVRISGYFHTTSFEKIMQTVYGKDRRSESDKPGMLIIDDDINYVERLRIHLEPFFDIYVSHLDLREATEMISHCEIMIISTKGRFSMIDMMEFFRAASRRKRSLGLKLYYLTDDPLERDRLNAESERDGIALCKVSDPEKMAVFFRGSISGRFSNIR